MIEKKKIFRYKILKLIVPLLILSGIYFLVKLLGQEENEIGDELVVACEPGYFGYIADSTAERGFQYELVKRFAEEQQVKLKVVESLDFKEDLSLLKEGKIDMMIGNIPAYKSLREEALISMPWFVSSLILVQRKDDQLIKRAGDLDGMMLVLPAGSAFGIRISNLSDEIAGNILINRSEESMDSIFAEIVQGKTSYSVCLKNQVSRLTQQYPGLNFSLSIGFDQEICWLIDPKRRILKERLDHFMETFTKTKDYQVLLKNYY